MSRAELYRSYKLPAGSKCIRVLDVSSVAGSTSNSSADAEPITCTFDIVGLDDRPSFTALSYVWGKDPPTSQFFILCEGLPIPVTRNCDSALRHLRQKLGRVRIWVDAVCIDQVDIDEKERQIPLMGDIYSKAEVVYAWLGDGTPATNRAMRYLANQFLLESFKASKPTAAAWAMCTVPWRRSPYLVPLRRNKKPWNKATVYTTFSDLEELFRRPWIKRVWTYQEILLANNPVVVCGHAHVHWNVLEYNLQLFAQINGMDQISVTWRSLALGRQQLQSSRSSGTKSACLDHDQLVAHLRKVQRSHGLIQFGLNFVWLICVMCCLFGLSFCFIKKLIAPGIVLVCLSIFVCTIYWVPAFLDRSKAPVRVFQQEAASTTNDLVSSLYSRQATNPKDMAFGMFAVLEKRSTKRLKAPDYSSDIGDIYRMFTVNLLQVTNTLDIFIYAAARSFHDQPSWVPDWTAHNRHGWGDNIGEMITTDDYGQDRDPVIQQALSPLPVVDETNTFITIWAYHVATLSACASVRKTNGHLEATARDLHVENIRWVHMQKSIDNLTDGQTRYRRPSGRSWNSLVRWCNNKTPTETITLLENSNTTGSPAAEMAQIYLHEMQAMARSTTFIAQYPSATAIPECSGVCSSEAKVGDIIIRIKGLPHLLLVRPRTASTNAVEIVSPVVLNQPRWSLARTLLKSQELEKQFIQYDVY